MKKDSEKVELELSREFDRLVLERFGRKIETVQVSTRRAGCFQTEFIFTDDAHLRIRLSLDDGNSLTVGWGANNLLTTNSGDYWQEVQIQTILFVADIFKHELDWRKAISDLDWNSLITAYKEEQEAEQAAVRELDKRRSNAFKEANIGVGTVLSRSGNFLSDTMRVKRVTATRILVNSDIFGDKIYPISEVSDWLLAGTSKVIK